MARRFPLIGKTLSLGGVLAALILGLQMVSGVVSEREGRLREAERGVAVSLAAAQTLVGPMLTRDCVETWESTQGEGKDKKTVTERGDLRVSEAPVRLDVKAGATTETLHRGIYKVNAYVMKAKLVAAWSDGLALTPHAQHANSRVECDAPVLFVALGDARGVRSAVMRIDGAAVPVLPGTTHSSHPRGFHAAVAESYIGARRPLATEIEIEIAGTGQLAFAPVGGNTRVELASNWPHPSFGGRFLPIERKIGAAGFSAVWEVNSLATTAPQATIGGAGSCGLGDTAPDSSDTDSRRGSCIETFGVGFIDPVNPYVLSDRATKYGLLFIALTFVGVGLVEVMRRLRVHPIQYLLVGSAVVVFFLLLVSLSEHVAFGIAYLAAAGACTALLTFYGCYVLGGTRAGAVFGAGIAGLYGTLYLLLQLEQRALLLGSILLFTVLAVLMVATRRIDWYALFNRVRSEAALPPAPMPAPVPAA